MALVKIIPFMSFWSLGFFAFASVLASAFSGKSSIRTRWFSLESCSTWEAGRSCWGGCSFQLLDFCQGIDYCCDGFFLIFQASLQLWN